MDVDDELCMCFHVSWRKVMNFIRIHRVRLPSQIAECQGAGTGCGWCRAAMRKLVDRFQEGVPGPEELQEWLDSQYRQSSAYAEGRRKHIADGRGRPPEGT